MKLIVGLGNPGPQYAQTRHNVGFLALDAIADHFHFSEFKAKKSSLMAEGEIGQEKVILLKPLSYMNLSGIPTSELARFFKISPEHIYVLHDDLDLPFGKIKVKQGGGHAGHNGLKSLDAHIGNNYWRVRIGIGHPGQKELVTPYVLSDFSKSESAELPSLLESIAEQIPALLSHNLDHFPVLP
jgi:PTH1 family peptidyl-tRNA hydrolase